MENQKQDVLLGCPGLAEGTNANTFKITNAFHYSIAGILYTKAATDNIAFATGGDAFVAQADLTSCLYRVVIDSAGTVLVVQGTPVVKTSIGPSNPLTPPDNVADNLTIGYIRVDNSAGTFTPASTDLGAGTVTDTYVNSQHIGPLSS